MLCPVVALGSCTFEEGECGWTDESLGDKMWSLVAAGTVGTPYSDHTFSTTAFKGNTQDFNLTLLKGNTIL